MKQTLHSSLKPTVERKAPLRLPNAPPPHLALLDLAADDLPPLLDDVNQEVALFHELPLLAGRIHLRTG